MNAKNRKLDVGKGNEDFRKFCKSAEGEGEGERQMNKRSGFATSAKKLRLCFLF